MRNGKCDFKELRELQKQVEQMNQSFKDEFFEQCAKELAARLLRKVIKRTPVGKYDGEPYVCEGKLAHKGNKVTGKTGGTLRRGWGSVKGVRVIRSGSLIHVTITNPVEYASYVEYGHRTRGGGGWVKGHLMLTTSVQEIRSIAPTLLQKRLEAKLREVFG